MFSLALPVSCAKMRGTLLSRFSKRVVKWRRRGGKRGALMRESPPSIGAVYCSGGALDERNREYSLLRSTVSLSISPLHPVLFHLSFSYNPFFSLSLSSSPLVSTLSPYSLPLYSLLPFFNQPHVECERRARPDGWMDGESGGRQIK